MADPVTTPASSNPTSSSPAPTGSAHTSPKTTDPAPTHPKPSGPATTDSKTSSPAPTQSKPSSPTPTQSKPSSPAPTQSKPSGPTPTDSKTSSPAPTQSKPSGPTPTDSKTSSPAPTQSKPSGPTPTDLKTSGPTPTNPKASSPAPTYLKPVPTSTSIAKSTHPAHSEPASTQPTHAMGPTSVVPTSRHVPASDHTSTSSPPVLESSTAVVSKPSPASTQPSPGPTSQDQFTSSQGPTLTKVFQPETTKPIIREPFNVTVSQEDIQDPKNKEEASIQICQMLLEKLSVTGNCSLSGEKVNDDYKFTSVLMAVDPLLAQNLYDKISTPPPAPTAVPHTLIAILSSCGALVLILVCFALYCMYHHRSYRKNQQHLTEELQTVENGYHDNPTLEVMEVQPEMQEKKVALNGEFNDSWIVPFDNLAKEDIPDEEDTHL